MLAPMAKKKFGLGDVVYLKSGGPALTVEGYRAGDTERGESKLMVTVSGWSRSGENIIDAAFPEACLTVLKPKVD